MNTKIIIADDDIDDRELIQSAFKDIGLEEQLQFAIDGSDLMDLLNKKQKDFCPSIILLDLNMPKKDGRQALKEIKDNITLKTIPVIIFTTSKSREDIECTYEIGANCFITKPRTYSDLVKIIKSVVEFWLETVTLPEVIRLSK